jgi:hypothetical protein
MSEKPITKGTERRGCISRGVSGSLDGTVLPQKIGEPLNTRRVGSRNVFLVTAPRTLAAVYSESLYSLFINIREIQAFGFQPSAKVNG